jgi:hypothetical protein
MSGVVQNIDPPLVRGEDTLAGWRGGGGSIIWKTPDKALYSTYVNIFWVRDLTANAVVATVLHSIPASSDTVESEGRQMKECGISYIKRVNPKIPL